MMTIRAFSLACIVLASACDSSRPAPTSTSWPPSPPPSPPPAPTPRPVTGYPLPAGNSGIVFRGLSTGCPDVAISLQVQLDSGDLKNVGCASAAVFDHIAAGSYRVLLWKDSAPAGTPYGCRGQARLVKTSSPIALPVDTVDSIFVELPWCD